MLRLLRCYPIRQPTSCYSPSKYVIRAGQSLAQLYVVKVSRESSRYPTLNTDDCYEQLSLISLLLEYFVNDCDWPSQVLPTVALWIGTAPMTNTASILLLGTLCVEIIGPIITRESICASRSMAWAEKWRCRFYISVVPIWVQIGRASCRERV